MPVSSRAALFQALKLLAVLMLTSFAPAINAQFACTLGARTEDACLALTDDDGSSCVWCSLSSFGVCLNEASAEAAEQSLPGIQCDRANPSGDDATPPAEDDATTKPPAAPSAPSPRPPPPPPPKTDDAIKPNDDKVPDNFWNCLNHDKAPDCKADKGKCTWCTSKAGYGLCMSGPAAKQAQHSHFFKCDKDIETSAADTSESSKTLLQSLQAVVHDPLDASCITAYLQDPTQEGCTSAVDQDGAACEWCSLAGLTNVCLTPEQAEQGASLGITCDGMNQKPRPDEPAAVAAPVQDPYDPACMLAYVREPTQSGCSSGVDQEGTPCQFCTWMGFDLCLTAEQVEMGQAAGIDCSAERVSVASLEIAPSAGGSVTDFTCLKDFFTLHDPQPSDCDAIVDADGQPCQYCSVDLQGNSLPICLSAEQAALAAQFGGAVVSCTGGTTADETQLRSAVSQDLGNDMLDPSCWQAYVQGGSTGDACSNAMDEDGAPCQYCTRDAVRHVCATATQADLLSGLGFWCENNGDGTAGVPHLTESKPDVVPLDLPDDFLECLEHYQQGDCAPHGCTWCSTQVGVAFCMSNAVADAMKECSFFDCQYKQAGVEVDEPLDSTCMNAGFHHPNDAEQVCNTTQDQSGTPCVWCHSQDNMVGLCFSAEQANKASGILQCDAASYGNVALQQ